MDLFLRMHRDDRTVVEIVSHNQAARSVFVWGSIHAEALEGLNLTPDDLDNLEHKIEARAIIPPRKERA